MKVKCPTCKKEVEFSGTNRYRPFCSERCSTLDLGAWADEKYRVPIEDATVNENPEEADDVGRDSRPKNDLN